MLRTKTADRIVCIAAVFMLIAAVCLWGAVKPLQGVGSHGIGYESRLFDADRVHTIEIAADDWEDILAGAAAEKYRECTVTIDGENLGRAGIRAKGTTSIASVAARGSDRYSFKVEFDHYMKGKRYYGLDRLSLNNMIRDATMMKDYLAYRLMDRAGIPAPLCSYVQVIVNGEPRGLYLAVEDVDDAFRERNGMTKGELYKPDAAFPGTGSSDIKLIYTDDNPDSYSNIFDNAKTKIKAGDKIRLISSLKKLNAGEDLDNVVNRDEVISFLAVHNFLCNDDSYTGPAAHNYYLHERKGKLSILPWDYDQSFGGYSAGGDMTSTINSPIDNPVSGSTTDSRPLISWIFGDENSLAAYHETYDRFLSQWVDSGWLTEEIARVQEMIRPYFEDDPSGFFTADAHVKAVEELKAFCERRAESVHGQLNGTIPSTAPEQRGNRNAPADNGRVDAANVSGKDMNTQEGNPLPSAGLPESAATAAETDGSTTEQPAETWSGISLSGLFSGTGTWIGNSICVFLLLAAILIIRRLRAHNG